MTNCFSKQISYYKYINYCIKNNRKKYSQYDINIYDMKKELYKDVNNIIIGYVDDIYYCEYRKIHKLLHETLTRHIKNIYNWCVEYKNLLLQFYNDHNINNNDRI